MDKNTLLLGTLGADPTETYDFCMCNPPFFGSAQELNFSFKSRKESRPRPRNAFCANVNEVVASGGEVEFVTRLIKESAQLNERIRVYSTMIGHKSSLVQLKKSLREVNVVSFKQTEFCQGHTTRWGLAWTFCDIDLRKVPEITLAVSRKSKPKQPFKHVLLNKNVDVKEASGKIENLMHDLLVRKTYSFMFCCYKIKLYFFRYHLKNLNRVKMWLLIISLRQKTLGRTKDAREEKNGKRINCLTMIADLQKIPMTLLQLERVLKAVKHRALAVEQQRLMMLKML